MGRVLRIKGSESLIGGIRITAGRHNSVGAVEFFDIHPRLQRSVGCLVRGSSHFCWRPATDFFVVRCARRVALHDVPLRVGQMVLGLLVRTSVVHEQRTDVAVRGCISHPLWAVLTLLEAGPVQRANVRHLRRKRTSVVLPTFSVTPAEGKQ